MRPKGQETVDLCAVNGAAITDKVGKTSRHRGAQHPQTTLEEDEADAEVDTGVLAVCQYQPM
jgi:hypothetical protein